MDGRRNLPGQDKTFVFYAVTLGLAFGFAWFLVKATQDRLSNPERIECPVDRCARILRGSVGPDGRPNALSQLEARELPNRRLVRAFGIENPFTTTDRVYATWFVQRARQYMNISETGWRYLAISTREAVDRAIDASIGPHLHPAHLVQAASLDLACRAFVEGSKSSDESHFDITRVTKAINDIWIHSKIPGNGANYVEHNDLHDALRAICPGSDPLARRENPLNWILPSFETLWRVVLRALMEIHVQGRGRHEWHVALESFSLDPTKEAFEARWPAASEEGVTPTNYVSVETIVLEALRLYPSTRHVKRAFRFDQIQPSQVFEADIEGIQVDKEIWGDDALKFLPERWARVTQAQKGAFMPFGNQPFACPARHPFGPRAIGLLFAVLRTTLDKCTTFPYFSTDPRTQQEPSSGSRFSLERDRYLELQLTSLRNREAFPYG